MPARRNGANGAMDSWIFAPVYGQRWTWSWDDGSTGRLIIVMDLQPLR